LKDFSPKQINFACEHKVLNALPFIKKHGIYDLELLKKLELVTLKRYGCILYEQLKEAFKKLCLPLTELDKHLIAFLKRVDRFDPLVYSRYIRILPAHVQDVGVAHFFADDYEEEYSKMIDENAFYDTYEACVYEKRAEELSWIDRVDNGYYISIPKTIEDFRLEGILQHNCVFRFGFYRLVTCKESIIVFLRKEKHLPYVTIEYDYVTFEVIQAHWKYNSDVSPELYQYIVELGKKLYHERLFFS
jgi:hypothetical protein